ncbi:MAG: protoheme IX farnesyltransferase, partial [Hyphomicrobiales bacterium]|nr:protoheme IX farnesyltransferase [Hyphomicrobiales bacterium]
AGRRATRAQILVYTLLLVPVALAPTLLGFGGLGYGLVALLMGAGMLQLALKLYRQREEKAADLAAKRLFGFSILYLTTLFGVLLLERIVALVLAQGEW